MVKCIFYCLIVYFHTKSARIAEIPVSTKVAGRGRGLGFKFTLYIVLLVLLANVNSRSRSLYYVVVRPPVCLSVCLSVTFVHLTQVIEIFGNVSTPFNTLII